MIVVVEDSNAEAEITTMSLRAVAPLSEITRLRDGRELLDFIDCNGKYSSRNCADNQKVRFILLDINMPRMSGIEALSAIKKNEKSKNIPVVMFSSSDVEKDVEKCFNLGANSFVKKPVSFSDFRISIDKIANYWLDFNLSLS
ncbi:MAG: response regulator [Bacteroidetes bacterium]|nr:response regulator [Bacteroidota bacterium]